MVNLRSYKDNVQSRVKSKIGDYLEMLVTICGEESPTATELFVYLNGNGYIRTTRKMAQTIEGCQKVFDAVLNYKVEFYNPCMNMINDINRMFRSYTQYPDAVTMTDAGVDIIKNGKEDIFSRLTHPDSHLAMYTAMAEMLEHDVFHTFNDITIVMYTEAVAIHRFNSICDLTNASISGIKHMILEARRGNGGMLIEYCTNNTVSLGEC